MIGLGILIRIVKAFVGKPLENTGLFPTRYYLQEALRSLDQDNIGEAIKFLKISKGALLDRSRWKLVRQLILFRCRVLRERHGKRIGYIEGRIEKLKIQQKLPWRWFRKRPTDRLTQYQDALALEKEARLLLDDYERELKDL
ncbi:MAG: hypothetical protein GTO12_00590 [Proteobacteria bacterium]|nr:hypothetical protein [Pseudomonadota bacterium]